MAEPNEPLTERELEVVKFVAQGASNKQIAAGLFVSENTVKAHLKNIFVKLEVESRARVAAIAQRNGWVDGSEESEASVVPAPQAASKPDVDEPIRASMPPVVIGDIKPLEAVPAEPAPAAPIQPVRSARIAVPVAPNPSPQPTLALWRRIAVVFVALGIVFGSAFSVQANRVSVVPVIDDDVLAGPNNPGGVSESSRWHERVPMPAARTRSVAFASSSKIYVIGGAVERAVTGETLVYTIRDNAWRAAAEKPTPLRLAAGAVLSDVIYMPGGLDAAGAATDRFERFDIASETWDVLPKLPRALSGHVVVATFDNIYVFGGKTASDSFNQDGYVYALATGSWSRIGGLPTARSQAAAALVNDRIYVVGGTDGQSEFTTCEYYIVDENRWGACKPMIIGRGGLGLASVAGGLYAIGGGVANKYVPFNERYDVAKDRWTPFEIPINRAGIWKNTAVASLPTEFYVFGGSTGQESRNENYVFEVLPNRSFLPQLQNSDKK